LYEWRDSYASCNAEGRLQRDLTDQLKAKEQLDGHDSYYELKWPVDNNAEAYKKEMSDKRRKSLAFRGEEHQHVKEIFEQMKSDEQHNEHELLIEMGWREVC